MKNLGKISGKQAFFGLIFLVAFAAGIARGETADILRKAIAVCLECIGIA